MYFPDQGHIVNSVAFSIVSDCMCYCAKHNQHANTRVSGGMPLDALRLNLREFWSQNIIMYIIFKSQN